MPTQLAACCVVALMLLTGLNSTLQPPTPPRSCAVVLLFTDLSQQQLSYCYTSCVPHNVLLNADAC